MDWNNPPFPPHITDGLKTALAKKLSPIFDELAELGRRLRETKPQAADEQPVIQGKKVVIYGLYDPRDNVPRYVGQTKQEIPLRLRGHIAKARKTAEGKAWLQELGQLKLKPFIKPLEMVENAAKNERVQFWITHFRSLGYRVVNEKGAG